jgi:hypothetical protein
LKLVIHGVGDAGEATEEGGAELGDEFLDMLRAAYRGICCPGIMLRSFVNDAIGRGAGRLLVA